MNIEELKSEVLKLTVRQKINPHAAEWQQLRQQIYEWNHVNHKSEIEQFREFQQELKGGSEFDPESVSLHSDDSSGSDSSVYKSSLDSKAQRSKINRLDKKKRKAPAKTNQNKLNSIQIGKNRQFGGV